MVSGSVVEVKVVALPSTIIMHAVLFKHNDIIDICLYIAPLLPWCAVRIIYSLQMCHICTSTYF